MLFSISLAPQNPVRDKFSSLILKTIPFTAHPSYQMNQLGCLGQISKECHHRLHLFKRLLPSPCWFGRFWCNRLLPLTRLRTRPRPEEALQKRFFVISFNATMSCDGLGGASVSRRPVPPPFSPRPVTWIGPRRIVRIHPQRQLRRQRHHATFAVRD